MDEDADPPGEGAAFGVEPKHAAASVADPAAISADATHRLVRVPPALINSSAYVGAETHAGRYHESASGCPVP